MPTQLRNLCFSLALLVTFACACQALADVPPTSKHPWRALHVINYDSDGALAELQQQLPKLASVGINCVILEVSYRYAYTSHPELRQGDDCITPGGAKNFAAACRGAGIEIVPQFQCLGHQSWKGTTFPLLTKYPELDLTPGAFIENKDIYCREWDPMNHRVLEIVLPMIDELCDAFDAKAVHVGMDEIFLLDSEHAKSTNDLDPADVFAKAVNDLHDHIVTKRGRTMLMWADRLIDGRALNMGKWEASENGTAAAVDKLPKDIILCPWHYETRDAYESLPLLMNKGFRILPSSWKNTNATLSLIENARETAVEDRLVGHIFTTWSGRSIDWSEFEPIVKGLEALQVPATK